MHSVPRGRGSLFFCRQTALALACVRADEIWPFPVYVLAKVALTCYHTRVCK